MPIGTGNDLSQILGYGNKMNLLRLDGFIKTILRDDLPLKKFDLWEVTLENSVPCLNNSASKKRMKKYKPVNFKKGMLLYLGLGYDAYVIYYYEQFRRFFPLMMISTKLSKLYFAFMFFYMFFKSFCRSFLTKLYLYFDASTTFPVPGTEQAAREGSEGLEEEFPLSKISNLIILNGKSRAGGFKNEWNKSCRAAVKFDGKNILLKKNKNGNWLPKAELYAQTKSKFFTHLIEISWYFF